MVAQKEQFTLKQEHIDMLINRRALDTEFKDFMAASLADRRSIREELAENTRATREVHLALFAKDDDNELGITGLVVSMQRVLEHMRVVCLYAKWAKRAVIGIGTLAAAVLPVGQILGWWG